ncbi:MAG: trypsin-like peptidase domain-containing protein [Deltaproteobacteria bacterium]|nr:trypsin-like peptidase domain-containing protein [Deltaproteobacteria bacterium]
MPSRIRLFLGGILLWTLLAWPLYAHPDSFAKLVKAQRGKVVHISTIPPSASRPAEDPLLSQPSDQFQGMGSGFIVDPEGLIVTNFHVIQDAGEIIVHLENERRYTAQVVGVDARTDLAVIRIPAQGLPAIKFGDSSKVEVGDWVVAIGNPLGLDHSVTAGIISAKGRNIFDTENVAYGEFLQTDAAINPGNSGGPLFNLDGEVIGVNTAISSVGQGIGFAVPSNLVADVIRQLKDNGRVIRGWLGVVIQEVTPDWAASVGLPAGQQGILVNDVVPGAPADSSHLQRGDVLISFEGEPLRKVPYLQKLVALTTPGKVVHMELLRQKRDGSGWDKLTVTFPLGRAPEARAALSDSDPIQRLEIRPGRLREAQRKRLMVKGEGGVLVEDVQPEGLGQEIGLKVGDVILEVNRSPVRTPEELSQKLRQTKGSRALLLIWRNQQAVTLILPLWE